MEKKLPNLYVNRIDKHINNNAISFYSFHKKEINKENTKIETSNNIVSNIDIQDKVDEIFNSPNYVYKMDVVITLKNNDVINKSIIGQTDGKLLTIDDDLIDIKEIKEINF